MRSKIDQMRSSVVTFSSACIERVGCASPVGLIASDTYLLRYIISLARPSPKLIVRYRGNGGSYDTTLCIDPSDWSVLPFSFEIDGKKMSLNRNIPSLGGIAWNEFIPVAAIDDEEIEGRPWILAFTRERSAESMYDLSARVYGENHSIDLAYHIGIANDPRRECGAIIVTNRHICIENGIDAGRVRIDVFRRDRTLFHGRPVSVLPPTSGVVAAVGEVIYVFRTSSSHAGHVYSAQLTMRPRWKREVEIPFDASRIAGCHVVDGTIWLFTINPSTLADRSVHEMHVHAYDTFSRSFRMNVSPPIAALYGGDSTSIGKMIFFVGSMPRSVAKRIYFFDTASERWYESPIVLDRREGAQARIIAMKV